MVRADEHIHCQSLRTDRTSATKQTTLHDGDGVREEGKSGLKNIGREGVCGGEGEKEGESEC